MHSIIVALPYKPATLDHTYCSRANPLGADETLFDKSPAPWITHNILYPRVLLSVPFQLVLGEKGGRCHYPSH